MYSIWQFLPVKVVIQLQSLSRQAQDAQGCVAVDLTCCLPACAVGVGALQGAKLAPAAVAVAVGSLIRYAAPIPEGLTDQVCALA